MKFIIALLLVLAAAIAVLPQASAPQPRFSDIPTPARPGSGEPNITTAPGGRVYLTWVEEAAKGHALKFASLGSDGKWTASQTIAQGERWFVNSADFPSLIALADGTLAAHWLADNAPDTEAYSVNLTISRDRGRTWSKPTILHRDRSENQHGFVSLYPWGNALGAIWLDGRKLKDEEGDMALMATTIALDGKTGTETTVDGRVCDCCQTAAVVVPDGILAVYRDRSPREVRDIATARLGKSGWSAPTPLSKDNWEIHGCPVNGPAVSAVSNTVAAAWFTAPDDMARVQVAFSKDGGRTFGAPVRVDDGKPAGHVGVVMLTSGNALVSWTEIAANGAQVRIRLVRPAGTKNAAITVSSTAVSRQAVPRITRNGDQIVMAWTDAAGTGRVRTASMRIPAGL